MPSAPPHAPIAALPRTRARAAARLREACRLRSALGANLAAATPANQGRVGGRDKGCRRAPPKCSRVAPSNPSTRAPLLHRHSRWGAATRMLARGAARVVQAVGATAMLRLEMACIVALPLRIFTPELRRGRWRRCPGCWLRMGDDGRRPDLAARAARAPCTGLPRCQQVQRPLTISSRRAGRALCGDACTGCVRSRCNHHSPATLPPLQRLAAQECQLPR